MKPFTEEDIQAFVEQETASWQLLPDDVFVGVPDALAAAAKQGDREQLQISREDLISVMRQHRDKDSFAYQYSLLMTDYTTMMINLMKNPTGESHDIQMVKLNVVKNGLRSKLTAMERWYHTVFTDTPVSDSLDQEMLDVAKNYQPPAPPAQTGCLVFLFTVLSASACLLINLFLPT